MKVTTVSLATLAILLTFSSSAHAALCPAGFPIFRTIVQANTDSKTDCESTPIHADIFSRGAIGDAAATGDAAFALKAKAGADYIIPEPGEGSQLGAADMSFQDEFPFFRSGTGFGTLVFTVDLTGAITLMGDEEAGTVEAQGIGSDRLGVGGTGVTLFGPGTGVFQSGLLFGVPDVIVVDAFLQVGARASAEGSATSDFSDTFAVTKIQLFDSSGNLLENNVTLTDNAGNVLGGPPLPAVPEPSSALLLAAGLGLLAFAKRHVRALTCEPG